jgi:hypothetical protein
MFNPDPTLRILIEIISVIACCFLLRFMIKPYIVTREARYIGLPLGFGFLCTSYVLSAIAILQPYYFSSQFTWLQPLEITFRTFAFTFLAVNYYFSRKPTKTSRIFWDLTLSILIVSVIILCLIGFIIPLSSLPIFQTTNIFLRVFILICITYITIHCIREYTEAPDPISILVPFAYVLFGVSQYSHLISFFKCGELPFWGGLTLRLMALAVFLFVTYRTFYNRKKKEYNK